jgi:hypothetical protein
MHPSEKNTPVQRFYSQPSPVKAVLLAIADHSAHAGGARSHEYIHQLNLAVNLLEEVENLKVAMQAALNVVQLNLKGVEGDWPEGTDTPDGPDFAEIERRVKAALVTLHFR